MWRGSDLMAYVRETWKNREVERPRTFTKVENPDGTITLVPAEGNIIEPGTPIIAAKMNNIEVGIEEALGKADQAFQSASDGKTVIASSITAKGVPASKEDTFPTLAGKINKIVTDPSIGTTNAIASDLLAGKKAISQGQLITGTIPSKGAQTYTPGITALLIEAGQYLSGRQTIADVAVPVANVLIGTTIAGQAGTMPNNGARNGTITTQGGSIAIPAGYTTGGTISASFANNIPSNIKAGVNIGGVVGNLEPVGETKSEMFAPTNGVKTYTSSLGKKPIMVCLAGNSSNVRFAPNFYYDFKINSGIAIGTSITVASGDLKATLTLTALSSNSAQVTVSDVGYASGSMTCWIYVIFA